MTGTDALVIERSRIEAEIETRASRGYKAFCDSRARNVLPLNPPGWPELPEIVKDAWRAAAAKILEPV